MIKYHGDIIISGQEELEKLEFLFWHNYHSAHSNLEWKRGGDLKEIYNWINSIKSYHKLLHLQRSEMVRSVEKRMICWNWERGKTASESLAALSFAITPMFFNSWLFVNPPTLSLFLNSWLFLFLNSPMLSLFLNSWLFLFLNSPMLWLSLHFHHQSLVLRG